MDSSHSRRARPSALSANDEPQGDLAGERDTLASGTDRHGLQDLLNCARARLDASVTLIGIALNLREQLWWGLETDDMVAEVNLLKYAVKAHKWWTSQ
jgi:hypothetical protein